MKMKNLLSAVLILLCVAVLANAQATSNSSRSAIPQSPEAQNKAQINENNQMNAGFNRNARNQMARRAFIVDMLPPAPRASRAARKLLAVSEADKLQFAEFLKQPKTGLIRLYSQSDCVDENGKSVVDAKNDSCILRSELPASGASYSFRKKEHQQIELSDLQFKDGWLMSPGHVTQGIFTSLGNVDLATISLESVTAKFLTSFAPATTISKAEEQLKTLVQGISSDKQIYRALLPAKDNTTYLLRSIAYRGDFLREVSLTKGGGRVVSQFPEDKRVDVVVAFRIVRRETDGSLVLLWKELQRQDSPFLKKEKK